MGDDTNDYEFILYGVADRVARITLNRPEKRNALNFALRQELVHALRRAERDDDVTVVLIDGAGASFCSGYDMGGAMPESGTEPDGWVPSDYYASWTDQFARSCFRDWMTIWDLLKPVVAKVHGYCLAGGSELMSMCDIAFVADDAVIGYPPMRGMTTPDTLYFPWKLSMAHAKYLQLTGNSVSGREAAGMGWVAKSFPADRLEDEVMREVRPLSQVAPDLLAANKAALNQTYEIMGIRTALQTASQWHTLSGRIRPGGNDFGRVMREAGLRAAIEWRDGPFRREGFEP